MTDPRSPSGVLLLGGPSDAGKSGAAARLGRRLGIPWLRVDDLRLALEHSGAILPRGTDELRFFLAGNLPPQTPRDALIGVGEAMAPAIEMVARDRGIAERTEASLRTEASAKWLFGRWLAEEARRRGLAVLSPRPWDSLEDRLLAVFNV